MSHLIPDDLETRILALLDGDLSHEEATNLDAELCQSETGRMLFQKIATLHSALEEQAVSSPGLAKNNIIPTDRYLSGQRRKMLMISVRAAAVLLVSAIVLWLKSAQALEPLASFRLGPGSHHTLSHTGEGKTAEGKVLAHGSRLQLTRGTLEAEFDSGGRFIIEAPGDITVLADGEIMLRKGIAWFEIPSEAVGFTVHTPQLRIVDLGTEFGVTANTSIGEEVHVFKGSVEASLIGETEPMTLKAGEAARIDAGGKLRANRAEKRHFASLLGGSFGTGPIAEYRFDPGRNWKTKPESQAL